MGHKTIWAGAILAVGMLFSAPASAQYYQPGYGYAPPPQAYIPPEQAQRNYNKLARKQAEFYAKYGYPQPQPRYYAPRPQPRYYAPPRPRAYYAPPPRRVYRERPRYYQPY